MYNKNNHSEKINHRIREDISNSHNEKKKFILSKEFGEMVI